MKRLLLLAFAASIPLTPAHASNEDIGFGARAMGMADALTADSGGLSPLTLNPAALGHLRRTQMEAGIRRLGQIPAGKTSLNGMTLGAAAPLNHPIFRGALGISWIHDVVDPKALDRTLGLTYATRSWREIGAGTLDFGLTMKAISRSGREFAGSTSKFAVDLGTLYRWGEDRAAGFSILNINKPSTDIGPVSDVAPVIFKLGYTHRVHRFLLAMDVTRRDASTGRRLGEKLDAGVTVAGGVEHAWGTARFGSILGRSGLSLGGITRTWSLGAGWSVHGTRLDYAVRIPLSGSSRWGHAVSLSYRFGAWDPEGEYEKVLKDELRYRSDLTKALESAEIKQWKLAEELRLMRGEIDDLRREIAVKEAEAVRNEDKLNATRNKLRLKELEERRRAAQKRLEGLKRERERMLLQNKEYQFQKQWRQYLQLKSEGVSDLVLIDRLKKMLAEFQNTGVDLGEANSELQRLLSR